MGDRIVRLVLLLVAALAPLGAVAARAQALPDAPAAASSPDLDRLLGEAQQAYATSNPARGLALLNQVHALP